MYLEKRGRNFIHSISITFPTRSHSPRPRIAIRFDRYVVYSIMNMQEGLL